MLVYGGVIRFTVSEIGDTNKSPVTCRRSLLLESLGDLCVLTCLVISSLDPNDGDIGALKRAVGLEEDDGLGRGHGHTVCNGLQNSI